MLSLSPQAMEMEKKETEDLSESRYDEFGGYSESLFSKGSYTQVRSTERSSCDDVYSLINKNNPFPCGTRRVFRRENNSYFRISCTPRYLRGWMH